MSVCLRTARFLGVVVCSGAAVVAFPAHGAAAPTGTLMGILPPGYSSANCKQVTPPDGIAEEVDCDQNTDTSGPVSAVFYLLSSKDGLAQAFQGLTSGMTMASTCPGNQASPGPWSYNRSSDQAAGQVGCGTTKSGGTTVSMVAWTDNAKMTASLIGGTDMSSLYQWWKTKSG